MTLKASRVTVMQKRFLAIHRSVFSPHRLMIWIIHWLDISNEHSKRKSTCKKCKRTKTSAKSGWSVHFHLHFCWGKVLPKHRKHTAYIRICFIMYNNKNTRFKKIIGPTLKINSKHWHLNNEKRSSDFLQMFPLVFPTRKTVLKWHENEYISTFISGEHFQQCTKSCIQFPVV